MNEQTHNQKHVSIAKKELCIEGAHIMNTNNCLRISLSKDISIHCIDELYEGIHEMTTANNFSAIDINASQVSSIDTAGVQLILALKYQSDICDWQFTVSEMPESCTKVIHLLGVNDSDLH